MGQQCCIQIIPHRPTSNGGDPGRGIVLDIIETAHVDLYTRCGGETNVDAVAAAFHLDGQAMSIKIRTGIGNERGFEWFASTYPKWRLI